MANLYWLDRIQPEHQSLVGNKAFHLARLLQTGYPVVPGFVISAQMFWEFLETVNWPEPLFADLPHSSLRLDIDNPQQLQAIARQIRQAITIAPLLTEWVSEVKSAVSQLGSPVVILRPSLALRKTSWKIDASRFEPVIDGRSSALFNIQTCGMTEESLIEGLKQLWAQLFGAKSLFYWQRTGIPLQQICLAVLVQPLWSAIAAGTVQANDSYFQVQATPGLGMAITWGETIPDCYQIHTKSGAILSRHLGKKTIVYDPVAEPADLKGSSLHLSLRFLDETRQASNAIEDWQLEELIHLVQRLLVDCAPPMELEWVLSCATNSQPQVYLTQVIPQLVRASWSPTNLGDWEPLSSLHEEPVMNSNWRPLLTGLAVSQGRAIARASVIADPQKAAIGILPGTVLVAPSLPPQWLPLIQQAAAIVTEQGSMTSHGAIVAREVGVPAVMGATNATAHIQTGDLVMVDGSRGRIYRIEPNGAQETSPPIMGQGHADVEALQSTPPRPLSDVLPVSDSLERPPIGTQLMVNVSQLSSLDLIADLPIDGVGLLRSELLAIALLNNQPPHYWLQPEHHAEFVERLTDALCQFASALAPRPVFYRSLDLRSHEFGDLGGGEATAPGGNPVLGMRGTFRYTLYPTLFELELAALAATQQTGNRNIHLLLPFVRAVEEFEFCRQRVERTGLMHNPNFQIWIMAEVPSVLFLLPEYVKAGVKGISIGSNDLSQLLLGIDRDNTLLSSAFDERHPAVKAAIAQLIQQAHQAGIPCSICGQAPVRHPELIADLIRWGIDSISVEPEAVETTYWAIARAERRLLLETARQQP
ncbi:putative PEP-binding protein [Leptothermofonsia sp. ETS-13]|uniref:putative PEP-binding protein n=1 Tax=Leptothermofonsia sp. ETS-13 TaxID=3035696 RepID=UPI003B9DEBB8